MWLHEIRCPGPRISAATLVSTAELLYLANSLGALGLSGEQETNGRASPRASRAIAMVFPNWSSSLCRSVSCESRGARPLALDSFRLDRFGARHMFATRSSLERPWLPCITTALSVCCRAYPCCVCRLQQIMYLMCDWVCHSTVSACGPILQQTSPMFWSAIADCPRLLDIDCVPFAANDHASLSKPEEGS